MERNLYISKHLLSRYAQRFAKNRDIVKYLNITLWHRTYTQKKLIRELQKEIQNVFSNCKETKSHMNNTQATLYLYEQYGFENKFCFFHNHHILFVTSLEDNEYKGITCYDLKHGDNVFGNLTNKKFNKISHR